MRKLVLAALLGAVAAALVTGSFAVAGGGDGSSSSRFKAPLDGWQEDPSQVTTGEGKFRARRVDSDTIEFWLRYEDLEGDASQAHIHIGSHHETGGVSAWLCGPAASTNQGACPAREGEVHGFIERDDVVGPAAQGVEPGNIADLIRAMRNHEAYVNVHTSRAPAGEIRGDLGRGHERSH